MADQHPPSRRTELLPIRVRRTARPDGEQTSWFSVFCPLRSGAVALSECLNCADCEGVSVHPLHEGVVLRCRWSENADAALEATSGTLPEADRISVTAIMSKDTICVDPELSLKALLQVLLERGISGAPVVDATGRPLGIVSKTDLLREPILDGKVADIMTPASFTLSENASLARAAALMAFESVHRVPVVSSGGSVVGVVSALDIARWVAQQSGFCVPGRPG